MYDFTVFCGCYWHLWLKLHRVGVGVFSGLSSWTSDLFDIVGRNSRQPHDEPEHDFCLQLVLRGWAWGPLSANKDTADGLCAEFFTMPGSGPGQNSTVPFLLTHYALKALLYISIYCPVGCCKAWFLCQHQRQPAGITNPLGILFLQSNNLYGLMKRQRSKQANTAGCSHSEQLEQ